MKEVFICRSPLGNHRLSIGGLTCVLKGVSYTVNITCSTVLTRR